MKIYNKPQLILMQLYCVSYLTLVIMGALLDLRKAPPPFPPAAPAHWSTSILSIASRQTGV